MNRDKILSLIVSAVLCIYYLSADSFGAKPINAPAVKGQYYDDVVPDTLDLAVQAGYGLNYFTEIISSDLDYEMYFGGDMTYLQCHVTSLGGCQCKAMEAMCFDRLMSGSTQNLEREAKMMEKLVSFLGDDGLYWIQGDLGKHPWFKIPEPFVYLCGQGRLIYAMIAWYQYTGDPEWKDRIDKLVDGLDKIVIHKDDYAYFPIHGYYDEEYLRSCYTKRGWKDTHEPVNEKDGEEGSLFNHQGFMPGALAFWYRISGNPKALELSGKLVRFLTKPKFWDFLESQHNDLVGSEHALWSGHLHGHVNTLRSIFEYAIATNDQRLKEFVRDGYEWTRKWMCPKIGFVGDNQGCGCGRLIRLSVKLTEAGIGDYWEDIDQYIRNLGSRQQCMPEFMDYMKDLAKKTTPPKPGPDITFDRIPERLIGGFGGKANFSTHYLCCGPHGNMGLFYAWDSAVRYQDGTARINLLVNRASPWLDMYSDLPYRGKVVIKNKTAEEMYIRIPLWADKSKVHCAVNQNDITKLIWFGNYINLRNLNKKDEVTVTFPMKISVEKWVIPHPAGGRREYTCTFKGNTLVKIEPDLFPDTGTPGLKREYLLADEPPTKKVKRYVSEQVLKW